LQPKGRIESDRARLVAQPLPTCLLLTQVASNLGHPAQSRGSGVFRRTKTLHLPRRISPKTATAWRCGAEDLRMTLEPNLHAEGVAAHSPWATGAAALRRRLAATSVRCFPDSPTIRYTKLGGMAHTFPSSNPMKTEVTVRNCPTRFRFECPRTWDSLSATADSAIRYCDQCRERVYLCVTDLETIEHAKAGHCIARECPHETELPAMVIGRPDVPTEFTKAQEAALERLHRESGIDDSIRNIDAPRCCPKCQFPAPPWRVSCRVCGFEMGRSV
jgi:hypothetical protein